MSDGFGLDHLPYGVFVAEGSAPRVGVRYHDTVVDVADRAAGARPAHPQHLHGARGRRPGPRPGHRSPSWSSPRRCRRSRSTRSSLLLPFAVGDYVDFYASLDHATNVGRIFRPDQEPLLPNWRHLPVGYHGRGGTVVVSGTPVVRPCGQRKSPTEDSPTYGPSRRLDIEAELGFVVGVGSELGSRIPVGELSQHVFGVVGLNDWSARDIQAWEYVPLGPFLGKSFATSVSAWVTPLAALDAARVDLPAQEPAPLPYLDRSTGGQALDIAVEVVLNGEVVSRPPYRTMYWSPGQMLAHLTVNGASTRTGDLFASGTISGPEPDTRGSFLELSWGGKEPFAGGHDVPRGRRRGDPALLGARHRRRPDHPRRGHRPHRAGSSLAEPALPKPVGQVQDRGWPRSGLGRRCGRRRTYLGGVAMSSRRFGKSFAIGVAAVVVVGGGAIAAVGPERIHEKIFGEDEHESVSEFAREHHGINMHSQAVATVMEKLEGGAEEALGPNQMTYEDNAFPRSAISTTQVKHSFSAFAAADARAGQARRRHLEVDSQRPRHRARAGHLHRQPQSRVRPHDLDRVAPDGRTIYLGTAGGGVWKTDNITAITPTGTRSAPTSPAPRSAR